tara:strand:- start:1169 stop:1576 length:408 start_codon:yes stop_codon:yes gene_type:complete
MITIQINSLSDLKDYFHSLSEEAFPFRLIYKNGASRTLNQNGLYWQWMTKMAKYFSDEKKFTKDDIHDLMRHKFLGYEDRVINNTVIAHQLKSTTACLTGEMFAYMEKVDAWSADMGCLLPIPEESEYKELLDKN